jgi:hypothetical protein
MDKLFFKIEQAMKETLVGNYVFTDEELAQLYSVTERLLRNYDNSRGNDISEVFDPFFFVAMVNAVKDWRSGEDTFWEHINQGLIGEPGSPKIYSHLTGVIDRLGKAGKILYLSGCSKQYYATILAHAFAPQKSVESFLDLCWNLYSVDMNFTYTENDDTFELVAEELKKTFLKQRSLEDDIKLGSNVYSLRAGLKGMAIDSPQEMINQIENTISLIDRAFNGEVLDNDQYYCFIVCNWWAEKEKSFGIARPRRKAYERAITDYTAIRPRYEYDNKQAKLYIPSIRLKSNYYDIPMLRVYRDNRFVTQLEMRTFGTGITMATKELHIPIDEFVSEEGLIDYTLEISHCDEVIYNSRTSLFREYILFRGNREISQEECLPGNYVLFAPRFDDFSVYPAEIKSIPGEPDLYTFHSQEGEMLQNSKQTVFFVHEKQKRDIRIVADRKNNVKFIHKGEEYIVIDGEFKVVVRSDIDITKYGVRYESSDFRLKDFSYVENEEYRVFSITEPLNVCEPQKISVFRYADNKIEASYSVVKFNHISITYDRQLYFDEDNLGKVRFRTEKYNKSVSFDISQGDVIIPFDDGDIILYPPLLRWRIGNGDFSIRYEENLWYKDYSNSAELEIDLPTEMGYQVILNNNTVLFESASFNSYKLGETIWGLAQERTSDLIVCVKIDDVGIVPIMNICLKEKFIAQPFEIRGDELIWNAGETFVGDPKPRFRLSFSENRMLAKSIEINETIDENYTVQQFSLSDLEMGSYDIAVDLLKRVAFSEKPIGMYETRISYGNPLLIKWKNCAGKRVKINGVVLDNEELMTQRSFWIEHMELVDDLDGLPLLRGTIFSFFMSKKHYYPTMRNDQGKEIYTDKVYCLILDKDTCQISPKENFDIDFYWDPGSMISLRSNGKKRIKAFKFIEEEVR